MISPKIAIVHEWLVDYSGSEKVLEQIINIFPEADLFSIVEFLPDQLKFFIKDKKVSTSFIQNLPFAKSKYRSYLPLMPLAVEQIDVSSYDIVICSSHAVSKGVITNSNQLHICYCHSPMRYAWDLYHQYLQEANLKNGLKGFFAQLILHYVRMWDLTTANRVDYYVANSNYIAKRIRKVYRRTSDVIYPPVDTKAFELDESKEDFYLTASRLVPYKKVNVIVETFSKYFQDKKLVVIGDGPDLKKIKANASPNVLFLGYQPSEMLKKYMQKAKAFVFAADEDFGIMPVEVQACGTPVIAFKKGGNLETVEEGKTGIFFDEQSIDSLKLAVEKFESGFIEFDYKYIRKHSEKFDTGIFVTKFKDLVFKKYNNKFN